MSTRPSALLVIVFVLALSPAHASAASIDLNFLVAGTAMDDGPQDGVFDFLVDGDSLGQVNNNGFVNLRTAFEFDLASIPGGATVQSATLSFTMNAEEGPRAIELHGYDADGSIDLGDFSRNGLIGSTSLSPGFGTLLVFDVTAQLTALLSGSATFAGFNVREEPGNAVNFLVSDIVMTGGAQPVLSVSYVPLPGALWFLMSGLAALGLQRRTTNQTNR